MNKKRHNLNQSKSTGLKTALENSAKDTNVRSKKIKHKLRAMTNAEFCAKWRKNHLFCKSIVSGGYCCPISPTGNCFRKSFLNKPYIINGKYILIEVTNDAGSDLQDL